VAQEGSKQKCVLKIEITVPFVGYDTNKKNMRAKKQIKNKIKKLLKEECFYIPIYVEEDSSGYYEDITQGIKIEVK